MTLKKHNSTADATGPEPTFDYNQQQSEILGMSNELTDSNEPKVDPQANIDVQAIIDATLAKVKKTEKKTTPNAMGAVPASEYEKQQPGVTINPSSDENAYAGLMTPRQREDLLGRLKARTATEADMALLDESMIIDLPFIKASNFSIPGQYDPKPKDPSIRFRWVNCVNALQSNMQRFLALGFVPATVDDVDTNKTPLADSMIQGTQIKQYDVVLMKIPVLQLMALYKKNILDSAYKLDSATSGKMAEAAAGQAFEDLLGSDPDALNTGARQSLNKYRVASGREPVTFSRT